MNKQLSHRRETALQGGLVFAKSVRLELGDNILHRGVATGGYIGIYTPKISPPKIFMGYFFFI